MITITGLWKQLAGEWVLRGIDLRVAEGEIVAIVGPSGTGKSVLLRHVAGLLWPDAGSIMVGDVLLPCRNARSRARLHRAIGFVFQDGALLDSRTVRQNLRLALDDREVGRDEAAAHARIVTALERVQLDAHTVLDRFPRELSGGMRKRVGVARALVHRPRLLLFDEPTTGLDPRNSAAIHELIRAACSEHGASALVITHDLAALADFADRVVLLQRDGIAFDGSPATFFAAYDPAVAHFIGSTHIESGRTAW